MRCENHDAEFIAKVMKERDRVLAKKKKSNTRSTVAIVRAWAQVGKLSTRAQGLVGKWAIRA